MGVLEGVGVGRVTVGAIQQEMLVGEVGLPHAEERVCQQGPQRFPPQVQARVGSEGLRRHARQRRHRRPGHHRTQQREEAGCPRQRGQQQARR